MEKTIEENSLDKKQICNSQTIFDTKFMKIFKWFIPALIVFVVLMINYACKGIAPFGNKYVSYIDMEVGYVPVYYSLWDAVRGGGNFFYNFFLGAGSNVYGSLISNAFISPLTWLVVIIPRSSISAFLSWYLIIKLALMATTMYYFIRKVFPRVNPYLQILYSILWTFSGWTIANYTNIIWLDNLILYPILCLGIRRIFRENKMDLFVLVLTFCLIFSFYMSFLVLLMMIFCGATAIFFSDKTKEEKKKIVTKLVVGTLLSLFMSFVSFLPAFWQSWTSHRIANAKKEILYVNTWSKAIVICINCFAMFGFVKLLTQYKKDKKNVLMFIVMFALTTVTILIERVNMMWHTGSYQSFPYRFAFIPIFIMLCAGLYYFNNHYDCKQQEKKKFDYSLIALFLPLVFYYVVSALNQNPPAFSIDFWTFAIYFIGCGVGVFLLFRLFELNNKKLTYIIVPIIVFAEIFTNCFGLVGLNDRVETQVATDNFDEIYAELELPDNNYRYTIHMRDVANVGMAKHYNYPYFIRRQSLSTWLHIIGSDQVLNAEQLGYVTSNTVLTGMGSTYFANMTANVKYVISDTELSSRLYTLIDQNKDFYIYEYKFYLPYGGIFATDDMIKNIPTEYQGFAASNYLYNNVYNKTGDLVVEASFTKTEVEGNKIKYTINVPGDSLLYYNWDINTLNQKQNLTININGEDRLLFGDIYEVGYFYDETVEIIVDKAIENSDKLTFATIDVAKIEDLVYTTTIKEIDNLKLDGNKIKITTNGSLGESVYIPFNFDSGWKATLNGKEVSIDKSLNSYMSIKLEEGENVIVLTYTPPMFNVGLIVSIVFFVIVMTLWILNKYTKFVSKFVESKVFNNIFFWVGVAGFAIASILIYIKPIIETIIYLG